MTTTTAEYSTRNILDLPLDAIAPSPYQRRTHFAGLDEMAESIRAHGVMQPVTVRTLPPRDNDSSCEPAPEYELIAGERRLRAARLAGLETIPAIVRQVDDLTTMQLVALENLQRQDLNPLEVAQTYALLQQAGLKQMQIAEQLGIAQPTIANALRLLELPAEVHALVADGQLSATAARALLRWPIPAARELLAAHAVKAGLTVRDLERDYLPDEVKKALKKLKLLVEYEYYGEKKTLFNRHICCAGCHTGGAYCFDPSCYAAKQQAEIDARDERAAQAKAYLQARADPDQQHAAPAASDADADGTPPSVESTPPAYCLADLPQESWAYLPRLAACSADCPHRASLPHQRNNPDATITICLDPACNERLKQAEQEDRRALLAHDEQEAQAAVRAFLDPPPPAPHLLAYLLRDSVYRANDAILAAVIARRNLPLDAAIFAASADPYADVARQQALAALSTLDLITLAAELRAGEAITQHYRYAASDGRVLRAEHRWLLDPAGVIAEMEAYRAEQAAQAARQDDGDNEMLRECPDCGGEGCDGCRDSGHLPAPGYTWCTQCDGWGEVDDEACLKCDGEGIIAATLTPDPPATGTNDAAEGENVSVRACRVCGCTDDDCRQCIEQTGQPCHWVADDLCSACADHGPYPDWDSGSPAGDEGAGDPVPDAAPIWLGTPETLTFKLPSCFKASVEVRQSAADEYWRFGYAVQCHDAQRGHGGALHGCHPDNVGYATQIEALRAGAELIREKLYVDFQATDRELAKLDRYLAMPRKHDTTPFEDGELPADHNSLEDMPDVETAITAQENDDPAPDAIHAVNAGDDPSPCISCPGDHCEGCEEINAWSARASERYHNKRGIRQSISPLPPVELSVHADSPPASLDLSPTDQARFLIDAKGNCSCCGIHCHPDDEKRDSCTTRRGAMRDLILREEQAHAPAVETVAAADDNAAPVAAEPAPRHCRSCRNWTREKKWTERDTGMEWGRCAKQQDAPIMAESGACDDYRGDTCALCRAWTNNTKTCTAKASKFHGPRASDAEACEKFRA